MTSPIEEFLVKLGFGVDQPALRRFETALKDAGSAVEFRTSGIARDLVKWQVGIVSGFGAISVAVVGMADKIAMADQQFRLFGERMFMAQPEAKKLQIALDALGASLEDVAWDPELHQRFQQLVDDQDTLQKKLGGNFERNMIGIRNLRFEFTRLEVTLQYLAQGVVSKLFEAMGFDVDAAQGKLESWIDWLQEHLPEISEKIAKNLLPVLKQFWEMLKSLGGALEEFGALFSTTVGLLSNDQSIEGVGFSFEKVAKAVQHVVGWLSEFFQALTLAEKMLIHFASAASDVLAGTEAALTGNFVKAKEIYKDALKEGALGTEDYAAIMYRYNPASKIAINLLEKMGIPVPKEFTAEAFAEWQKKLTNLHLSPEESRKALDAWKKLLPANPDLIPMRETQNIAEGKPVGVDLIAAIAKKFNVDPLLALAVAQTESGMHQTDEYGRPKTSGAGAIGVMQLEPGTAKELHVNPYDTTDNIRGGVQLLSKLLQQYHGNLNDVLTAYNAGPGRVGSANLPQETVQYIQKVEDTLRKYQKTYPGDTSSSYAGDVYHQAGDIYHGGTNVQGGDVSVGDVHVHVNQPSSSVDDVQKAAMKGLLDAINYQTQRDLTNFASAY